MGQRKLSVLQVGKYYPPVRGGIETHLEMLATGLNPETDLEVVVANEGPGDVSEQPGGVRVRRLGTVCKPAGAPVCPGLVKVLRQTRADIVHVHSPHPTALVSYLLSGCRQPLVCSHHSDIVRQRVLGRLIGPIQDAALRRARAIITATPAMVQHSSVLARHRDKCVTIPYGLHTGAAAGQPDPVAVAAVRARFGPGPLLLAVGRLVYYKGFEYLVRAMARVPAGTTLVIIGEGRMRAQLEQEVAALGLGERVHLLGDVSDPTPYYQACDVFVLPSVARSEAFGIVQLEAMICGKPVVNTLLPSGVPFVSRDGETGFTVPPRDAHALAGAINRLLDDPGLRQRLGVAARARVHAHFSAERMIEDTLALYRRIATPDGGSRRVPPAAKPALESVSR